MAKVLICGTRTWDDWTLIREFIDSLPDDTVIVHGAAHGADTIAGVCAMQRGLEVRAHPAKWALFGKRAGRLRNQEMLDEEHPDLVVAFTHNIATSKGTRDMVRRARDAGIPVEIHPWRQLEQQHE